MSLSARLRRLSQGRSWSKVAGPLGGVGEVTDFATLLSSTWSLGPHTRIGDDWAGPPSTSLAKDAAVTSPSLLAAITWTATPSLKRSAPPAIRRGLPMTSLMVSKMMPSAVLPNRVGTNLMPSGRDARTVAGNACSMWSSLCGRLAPQGAEVSDRVRPGRPSRSLSVAG